MENSPIGARVKQWRHRRGLSRQQFADRVGRSTSWVDKIESGERLLVRLPMLERVADALGIPVATLTEPDAPSASRSPLDPLDVIALRTALQRVGAITGLYGDSGDSEDESLPDPRRLRRQVEYLWTSFQNAHYSVIGGHLPRLLVEAQDAVQFADEDERQHARETLSLAYQLTASTMWKLKESDLAWLAAERGFCLAELVGDPLLISDAARRVGHGLMATGHSDQALTLLRADMDRLAPGIGTADVEYLSVFGMLPLMASVVAARDNKSAMARECIAEGTAIAERLGADHNEHWTAFGPTNAAVHAVSALVDLGEFGEAIRIADGIDPSGFGFLPRERRATHLVDVARAEVGNGQLRASLARLREADRLASEEVRWRPLGRELIVQLRDRWPGKAPLELRTLAEQARIPA
jgi:transcriptional regulator with XRE-family HTH domain